MKLHFYLIVIAAGTSTDSFSQKDDHSVLAAAGDISKSATLVLEWTVGETAIETVSTSSSLYTQGFHQPSLEVKKTGSLTDVLATKTIIHVFPNPVTSVLSIQLEKVPEVPLFMTFIDGNGRVLLASGFAPKSNTLKINVSGYPQGTYYLRIHDNRGSTRGEYKVIKAQ